MKKQGMAFIITAIILTNNTLTAQAAMPLLDLMPAGQLRLDREPEQGTEGVSENSTEVSGNSTEADSENAETVQDVLNGSIGSGTILVSEKTAEDYELAYEKVKEE